MISPPPKQWLRYRFFNFLFTASLLFSGSSAQAQTSADELRQKARAALAQTSGEINVGGLEKSVEVIRDKWGVAHIYAKTQHDLFFAQGFVAAQDRLWQLDMWRRRAEGKLAEILGPAFVERDRYARLMKFRGNWNEEWKSYSPDAKEIIEAFVAGINAYIDSIGDTLPVEFQLQGSRPGKWTPEVCVSRIAAWPLTGNASREISRAELIAALGAGKTDQLMPLEPAHRTYVPQGVDLAAIGSSILRGINAAGSEAIPGATAEGTDGSNNWTISGSRTKSGKPILANDPHRAIMLPSLRYIVHLVGPGWDVIGAGEPALPGISIGHNQRIAFGLTVFPADQEDIVVERINPNDSSQFSVSSGAWEKMTISEDEVVVKGESAPRKVQLKFTRNGPVIYEDAAKHLAYVLRWVGSEPGTAGYLAGVAIDRAQNWNEFRNALKRWKLPPENFVYADVDGNIGYQAAGIVPRRQAADGLLPTQGACTECAWKGFLSLDELPHVFNPKEGFVATANHNTLPPGEKNMFAFEWSNRYRVDRIEEVLSQAKGHTPEDSARLQSDSVSHPAREVLKLLPHVPTGDEKRSAAVALLKTWDADLRRDSAAAMIYIFWTEKLRDVYKPVVPTELWTSFRRSIPFANLVNAVSHADPAVFGAENSGARRDAYLGTTLDAALADLQKQFGSNMNAWHWGTLHTAPFPHPLSGKDSGRKEVFNRGPVERPGEGNTVNSTSGAANRQTHGASYREVIDLSDFDKSLATNVPGQSGQPESKHYDDLLQSWAADKHFPLVYSRKAVEANAEAKLTLIPKGK
ncbi:MAG: penicillin acylase family protein [Acidobacteria bacterium]|nr:penicillin acylase family protein [Acidobacteriota bacterium]